MRISVVNMTRGLLGDAEVQRAIRAVNRQIVEDFQPYWNLAGQLRLEGSSGDRPDADNPEDMQGEAIIYLWDEADVPNALGYHEANYRGIPFGFVFVDIATELGEPWTVTFSHEALELIGDRQANLLVQGPNPHDQDKVVYHWHEMCDAVQDEHYEIDGIAVSNFVLPLYFTPGLESGSRNDFLGDSHLVDGAHRTLPSFGVNPGGYVGFYNPESDSHETFMDDTRVQKGRQRTRSEHRQERKNKARQARRGNRYAESPPRPAVTTKVPARRRTRIPSPGIRISIRTSAQIEVNSNVDTLAENRHRAGYFAFDISVDSGAFNDGLLDDGFDEVGVIELARPGDLSEEVVESVINVEHADDERLIAIVELEGVVFWVPPAKTTKKGSSFEISVSPNQATRGRRGSITKLFKTTVRFIRHKLEDAFKDLVKNRLTDFLAENVEKLAFRKKDAAVIDELHLLRKPLNGTLGSIRRLRGRLEPGKRYLLFIHGIFSSSEGAFGEILLNRYQDELLPSLSRHYDRVISFNHWTVAKSTLENAQDLLARLPDDCALDIVCHSRGAGVTRCLLEHPDVAPHFEAKRIAVGKVIFVAGACQGSPLANPSRIATLVNVFSALSSMSGAFFPLQLITALGKAVEYGVRNFPGIQAMAPASPIIKALNKPLNQQCEYVYMRANYEPSGRLKRMFDEIGLDKFVFRGKRNDGVVPFHGAATFDQHVMDSIPVTASAEFGVKDDHYVFHTRFFSQKRVREELMRHLGAA